MTVEEMQEHLYEVSESLYCRLDQPGTQPGQAGMMYVEFGYVEGPVLDDSLIGHYPNLQTKYLTCLHELGHFHHSHTQGRPWNEEYQKKSFEHYSPDWWFSEGIEPDEYFINGVLRSEAQAWNYALNKCLIPSEEILPETRAFMWDTCLGSYFNHAREVGFETTGQLLYNGDRAYVPFAYGKPDKYFFQTKRRILEGDIDEDDLPMKKQNKITLNEYQTSVNQLINVSNNTTWGPSFNIVYRAGT